MNSLSVISSNIRYDEPGDGPNAWQHRKGFLCERLRELGPDLLATQEGKEWQIRELAAELPQLALIDAHRDWDDGLMYPCLLYDENKLSLQRSGDIWLSLSPYKAGSRSFGSEFARLCTWALFEPELLAINVHLDHIQPETREKQIRVLLNETRPLRQASKCALLIGDFNEGPDGGVRAAITEHWSQLVDPWLQLGLKEDSSHHCFGEEFDYGSRVDWILAEQGLKPEEIFLDKCISPSGMFASDHYILKARFIPPWGQVE